MSDDLISREALRNEIDTWGCNDYDKYDFIEAIDNAPTVEYPEQITIKCDTEEDKQKLLSALKNAKLFVITDEQECYITGAQWDEFMKEHRRRTGAYDKIKAIINGWAVDDDEHELLEQIADIIDEEAENESKN
jgi:hypothetical protein